MKRKRKRYLFRWDSRAEGLVHIVVDFPSSSRGQVVRGRVILQLKLGPDDQVDDPVLDAIRPVVIQDLDVLCRMYRD